MKTTIMHLMSLFLILAFSASCGKKEGGSSSGSNNANNPVTVGNATGDVAYNAAKAWYDAADSTPVGIRARYLKSTINNSGVVSIPFMCAMATGGLIDIGNPLCTAPSGCFVRSSTGVQIGQVVMTGDNNKKFKECNITSNGYQAYVKANDAGLREAVLGNGTTKFVIPSLSVQSGSIIRIYYGAFSGSVSPTGYSEINTSVPAIVNPTAVTNGTTSTTKLIDFVIF